MSLDVSESAQVPRLHSARVAELNSGNSAPAIIAGLDTMAGAGVARALRGSGIPVIGIAADPRHYGCYTRACERVIVAKTDGVELIDALDALAAAGERGVVVPCTDDAVLTLARSRARVEAAHRLPLPDLSTVEMLGDKAAFYEYAFREELPIPRTFVLDDVADARRAGQALGFPCALKPSRKTAAWLEHTQRKAFKVNTPVELLETYERVSPWAERLLAQEWIAGDDGDLFVFRGYFDRDARPLATFVCRKIRQWPIDTGSGVSAVECRNDAVLQLGLRLFEGVSFYGHAVLELKRDAVTGKHLIVEPNIGRPTALATMAEQAGVKFLYTGYCDALGLPLPTDRQQHYRGMKCFWIRGDLRASLALRRQGRLSLREWIQSLRGPKAFVLFSLADPRPFLVDLAQAASNVVLRSRVARVGATLRRLKLARSASSQSR